MPIYGIILPVALKDRKKNEGQLQQPAWCFIWVSVLDDISIISVFLA